MPDEVAPPFDRFYMGGDTDIRGFDIRAVSPVALFPTAITIPLQNPDGTTVPLDPTNPRRGIVERHHSGEPDHLPRRRYQLVSAISSIAYRSSGRSRWRRLSTRAWTSSPTIRSFSIADQQIVTLNATTYGCPFVNPNFTCAGTVRIPITGNLSPISGTNYQPRMSTGLELQVIMPIVNAPFRVYYAYNPLRMDETVPPVSPDYPLDVPGRCGGRLHLRQRCCACTTRDT